VTSWRPIPSVVRSVLLAAGLIVVVATPSHADWVVSPFVGLGFNGTTNFIDFENGVRETKVTFGASGGWLSDGLVGVEANVGHIWAFFDSRDASRGEDLVVSSSVTLVTGDVLLLVPRAILRGSLRPYVVSGIGVLRVRADYVADVLKIDERFVALALGGGAIGRLTDRTSLRFELRRITNLTRREHDLVLESGRTRLTFWRASVGLLVEY